MLYGYTALPYSDKVVRPIVDTVDATDTAPVAWANIVDGLIQRGLPCQVLKPLKECIEIPVRLSFAMITNPTSVDSVEIRFRVFADPITRHYAAFLP
jgi:hypothetical protein